MTMIDEQRVSRLEDEVVDLKEKVDTNTIAIAQFSVIQENVTSAYMKLSDTLQEISSTMVSLSTNFDNTTKQITEMKTDISNINHSVTKLDTEIALVKQQTNIQENQIENNSAENKKNNIDMRDIVAKVIELAIFGGGIGLLVHYLG